MLSVCFRREGQMAFLLKADGERWVLFGAETVADSRMCVVRRLAVSRLIIPGFVQAFRRA